MKNRINKILQTPRVKPFKITLIYFAISLVWIIFSDRITENLFPDMNLYSSFQTVKGIFFITSTSLIIFVLIKRDIYFLTEQKRLFQAIVETSPVGIVITDTEGFVEYANPKFKEITGYTISEIIGENTNILKSGKHNNEFYKDLWDTIKAGKAWQGEIYNKKKNGEYYWELAKISPIMDDMGKIKSFLAVKEDITTLKKMIEELIIATQKAEEMNKVKSYFLANMSHELRTPFVGIMGYAELLTDVLNNPEEREMAEGILSTSQRLTDTLNKILNLTSLEFGKTDIILTGVNINDLINEQIYLFNAVAEKKNLSLTHKSLFGTLIIKTDKYLLVEILSNLLNNAVKFTEKGFIHIDTEIKETSKTKTLIIKVSDSGIGISDEFKELIWQEFRQVSEGISRDYQGTGLGLTITKKYVELLGGEISVKSEEGKGAEFIVELPVIE
jgi:PAS domain S-box-containing protein